MVHPPRVLKGVATPAPAPGGLPPGTAWVELYNAGSGSAALSGWVLATSRHNASEGSRLPSSLSIPPGGYLVVPLGERASSAGHCTAEVSTCAGAPGMPTRAAAW